MPEHESIHHELDDKELLLRVIEFYAAKLKESPKALTYLEKRGLTSSEMLERHLIGLSDRSLPKILPSVDRKEGKELRRRLVKLGILQPSGHERFRGSITVPVFDEHGMVVNLYGRKYGVRLRKGTVMHTWLGDSPKGVWNIEALRASKEVILCKSLTDALTFWCGGLRNVTVAIGETGIADDLLAAFERYGTQKVLVAFPSDLDARADEIADSLGVEGIECFRVRFPGDKDANDIGSDALEALVHRAVSMGRGTVPSQRHEDTFPDLSDPVDVPKVPQSEEPIATPVEAIVNEPSPLSTDAEVHEGEVTFHMGDRRWRIRGLDQNLSFNVLRVNLLVAMDGVTSVAAFHVDVFDLYQARHRRAFVKQASEELGCKEAVLRRDLGRVLLKLEELQESLIHRTLEPEEDKSEMDADNKAQALALLKDPYLTDRILEDFAMCGVVGERDNLLVGYLAAVSRKLDQPLAVVIQSSSAAGKTSLMEAILAFVPPEDRVKFSAMTGQSLFYMSEDSLKHRILAIVEESGAEKASYALKLLQSEGELMIASTGKEANTGRLVTETYRVAGPVMIFITTTSSVIEEELVNRCIVLTVNEDRDQTKAIHKLQRERQTLEGLLEHRERECVIALHQNAQRLLKTLLVANPFAEMLTFRNDRTRTRRDHVKYLTLIRAVALLHQYQREVRYVEHEGEELPYIEVEPGDIWFANRLAHSIMGRSLDELAPQTRKLLTMLDEMVATECERLEMERGEFRFTRRKVREFTNWSYDQVRIHIKRLLEMEYVIVHRGGRGQFFVYELLFDGQGKDGEPFVAGLTDPKTLEGGGHEFGPRLEGHTRPIRGGLEGAETGEKDNDADAVGEKLGPLPKKVNRDQLKKPSSYSDSEVG